MLASIPNKDSIAFREQVKSLFRVTDTVLTRQMKEKFLESYEDVLHYKVACTTLDEGFEDAFQYSSVGDKKKRLRSTNLLGRLHAELRRREKVIWIFPNIASVS